jgi:hypothetical protein
MMPSGSKKNRKVATEEVKKGMDTKEILMVHMDKAENEDTTEVEEDHPLVSIVARWAMFRYFVPTTHSLCVFL